jgi:hypothetical protein
MAKFKDKWKSLTGDDKDRLRYQFVGTKQYTSYNNMLYTIEDIDFDVDMLSVAPEIRGESVTYKHFYEEVKQVTTITDVGQPLFVARFKGRAVRLPPEVLVTTELTNEERSILPKVCAQQPHEVQAEVCEFKQLLQSVDMMQRFGMSLGPNLPVEAKMLKLPMITPTGRDHSVPLDRHSVFTIKGFQQDVLFGSANFAHCAPKEYMWRAASLPEHRSFVQDWMANILSHLDKVKGPIRPSCKVSIVTLLEDKALYLEDMIQAKNLPDDRQLAEFLSILQGDCMACMEHFGNPHDKRLVPQVQGRVSSGFAILGWDTATKAPTPGSQPPTLEHILDVLRSTARDVASWTRYEFFEVGGQQRRSAMDAVGPNGSEGWGTMPSILISFIGNGPGNEDDFTTTKRAANENDILHQVIRVPNYPKSPSPMIQWKVTQQLLDKAGYLAWSIDLEQTCPRLADQLIMSVGIDMSHEPVCRRVQQRMSCAPNRFGVPDV